MQESDSIFEKAKEHFLMGLEHISKERWVDAEKEFKLSLKYIPNRISTLTNLCGTLIRLKKFQEASDFLERAKTIDPKNPELTLNQGLLFSEKKQYVEALKSYERAIELNPDYLEAWGNRGVALNDLKRHEEALASYERAIELNPDYPEAWVNRGVALNDLKRHEEALASYDRAIELNPDYPEAWGNRGVALNDLKRHEEALVSYERAIELNPDGDFWFGSLIYTQMRICDWTNLEQRRKTLEEMLVVGIKASYPFDVLGLLDSPPLQKRCAEMYINDKLRIADQFGAIKDKPKRSKIRIGYFSMDFREHPVSHLIAELFELHDRNKFEVFGFSFGINTRDSMRQRLEKAFDRFLDVAHLNDHEIVRLSRQHEIDIAIDLGGHTQSSRPQIFAERVAPIQINYLGYPGTWGSDCIDYFIGDKVAITNESVGHFSEKIIFLPNSFQINPSHRSITNDKTSKKIYDLPDGSFVFCCFNNTWKITPEFFGQWLRILQYAPNTVLWLYADSPSSATNLKLEALRRGVSTDRIIFTERVPRDRYMAQFQHADLFLDTLPYNAGTTASDALWAGCPVLTQAGKSFASRMAASLLTSVGLPELITHTKEDYFSLAVELASNPPKLATIKSRLEQNRLSTPLFNTSLFAKYIESSYQAVYERYHNGLPPDHIHVDF